MTTPQRPFPSASSPFNPTPFSNAAGPGAPGDGMEVLHGGGDEGPEKRYDFWRMLRLTAALVAVLAVIVLGIRFLSPAPEPTPTGGADFTPGPVAGTTIDKEEVSRMVEEGISAYDATVAEVGGVNLALTSHLLSPNGNGLLQVGFNAEGDHILYSFDLAAEPTPIRFTRGETSYLNMTTPYPANSVPVAKIRDSEFVGEWSLSDPQDPTTNIPTLPEIALGMLDSVDSAVKGTSADGLSTQVVATVDGFADVAPFSGLLRDSIEGETQVSFLFDKDGRLVGVSVLGPQAREGDANAPQLTYVVPVGGFAAVEVPTIPESPGVAPENLPATGPWSNLVTLAIDIQRNAREAAAAIEGSEATTTYTPEVFAAIESSSALTQQLSTANATFDPATALLTDNQGRVVCLPLGAIQSAQDVATLAPTVYLDLCPSGEVADVSAPETPAAQS